MLARCLEGEQARSQTRKAARRTVRSTCRPARRPGLHTFPPATPVAQRSGRDHPRQSGHRPKEIRPQIFQTAGTTHHWAQRAQQGPQAQGVPPKVPPSRKTPLTLPRHGPGGCKTARGRVNRLLLSLLALVTNACSGFPSHRGAPLTARRLLGAIPSVVSGGPVVVVLVCRPRGLRTTLRGQRAN